MLEAKAFCESGPAMYPGGSMRGKSASYGNIGEAASFGAAAPSSATAKARSIAVPLGGGGGGVASAPTAFGGFVSEDIGEDTDGIKATSSPSRSPSMRSPRLGSTSAVAFHGSSTDLAELHSQRRAVKLADGGEGTDAKFVGMNSKLLECSDLGTGDYRTPSLTIEYEDGSRLSPMVFHSYRVVPGKIPMQTKG